MSVQQAATTSNDVNSANVTGFGISYAVASLFSAILVVLKESYPSVHNGLVAITGHHWVTHGLLNLIVFLVLGFVLSRSEIEMSGSTLIKTVVGATVLSGLIITGYFI